MRNIKLLGAALVAALTVQPAAAQIGDVTFDGVVVDTCDLIIGSAGLLDTANGNTELTSESGLGTSALAAITTTGSGYNLQVENPTGFALAPAGADANTTFEANYSAAGVTNVNDVVAGVDTPLATGLTNVMVDAKATKSSGTFPTGVYQMKSKVKCVAQ